MCAQRQNNVMLNLQILRISQVLYLEELLNLLHTILCQADHLILLVYDEVSGLLLLHAHDGIHLGILRHVLTALHLARQNIACFIQSGGFAALSGNDERCTRLIDQYRVDLVDDGKMQSALHQLLLIDYHVVTQIIKTKLIVCHVGNVTVIGIPALIVRHLVQNHADFQSQEFMNLSHPLRVTLCQIVIDCDDAHALALKRI